MNNTNNTDNTITRSIIADSKRMDATHALFGLGFPLRLEPTVFNMAGMLSEHYQGGVWEFYALSNGCFYMAPLANADKRFTVRSDNGFEGVMSADSLGICACLFACSHLSFGGGDFAALCGEHYHWLREYAMEHAEVRSILRAID